MPDQPTQIGPYRITEQLGRDGAAVLYRAADPAQGKPVLVHVLSPRLVEEPAALERFEREGSILARSPHPNILQVLAAGRDGDHPYLVTEVFDGVPLDEVLRGRRLSLPEAILVMKRICLALAHAHQHGVVHRRIGPHAVRVSPDLSAVKLTDFDFTRVDALGMTGTIKTGAISLAAFNYLAPEQTDSRGPAAADHRADLYSAGAIFHEMLTGRPPGGRFALPSHLNSELPPEADMLILKCLARDPAERYGTALELLAGIAKLEEASRLRLIGELRGIAQPGPRRRALMIGGLVLLLVLLAVVGYIWLRGESSSPSSRTGGAEGLGRSLDDPGQRRYAPTYEAGRRRAGGHLGPGDPEALSFRSRRDSDRGTVEALSHRAAGEDARVPQVPRRSEATGWTPTFPG